MSVIDVSERRAYLASPYFTKHEYGDFTPFYITIAICSTVVGIIIILNVALGCCSRYSGYWNDRHTGNRWIVSLWTATPHLQPSLDYSDIDAKFIPEQVIVHSSDLPRSVTQYTDLEFQHRGPQEYFPQEDPGYSQRQQFEQLELQQVHQAPQTGSRKESDI